MSIRVLPAEVASRIAAGEVIERPVSVVRELLDNALDAGATRIAVEIEDGGVKLIRVTDNGCGIAPPDLEVAFERHATSKLSAIEDLGHLRTLGFRGEALPSIAAASDVEIVTRAASEPVGVHALLVDSRVVRRAAKAAPPGTSLAARDLFARVPARRKFLGAAGQETRHVSTLVSHYALAYPGVAFTFVSNGRATLRTPGDGELRHAFAAIYGAEAAEAMLPVSHEEMGVRVAGLASPPGYTRGNRTGISVFVNGRWVQSRALVYAVIDAYQSQLPVGRYPVASIDVRVAEEEVDVNVHPAKAEVRFRDERAVGRVVRHAVRAALEASPAVSWGVAPAWPVVPGTPADTSRAGGQPAGGGAPLLALRAQPSQARLGLPAGAASDRPKTTHRELLPLLRVVGQVNATYIIAEGPDGMYLLDQHAAHERVRYEEVLGARTRGDAPAAQPLLEAAMVELDALQAATLEEHRDRLEALGFALEPFGERAYLARAIPVGLAGRDAGRALAGFLDKLGNERRVDDPFQRAAATVACHSSVRAGMALSMDEMRRLVQDLEGTAAPRTCPHGRPTLVHIGTESIERQFGRR